MTTGTGPSDPVAGAGLPPQLSQSPSFGQSSSSDQTAFRAGVAHRDIRRAMLCHCAHSRVHRAPYTRAARVTSPRGTANS